MHHIKPQITKPDGRWRQGKGFSREEVKKAGLCAADARKIGLPVDLRRTTVHDENVAAVKAYVAEEKAKPKTKAKPRRERVEKKEKAKS